MTISAYWKITWPDFSILQNNFRSILWSNQARSCHFFLHFAAQPGFLQHTQVLFLKYFLAYSSFFQGYKISLPYNRLLNKISYEFESMKELNPQIIYHEGEYIDQVSKRGGDSFDEQPRKNGLRYFRFLLQRVQI